jgi:hypothetical protein
VTSNIDNFIKHGLLNKKGRTGCKKNCELYKGDLQAAKEGPHKMSWKDNNNNNNNNNNNYCNWVVTRWQ